MSFDKEDLALFLLAESVELQHLDQALAGLLNDGDLEVIREELHTNVKVAEDLVDVLRDLLLTSLDNLIEARKQVVVDVEEQFDAPLFLVGKHRLDQLLGLVNDAEIF